MATRREGLALGVVAAILVGLPLLVFGARAWPAARAGDVRVIDIVARLPAQGGFAPAVIRVHKGERVRLRLSSADVAHGFRLGLLGVDVPWLEPGQVHEVEFVATEAGAFDFYCTVWCDVGHWRMRGTLQVVDPAAPDAWRALAPAQVPPDIDPDAPHPATVYPHAPPSPPRGAQWLAAAAPGLTTTALLQGLDMRRLSPELLYGLLQRGALPGLPPATAAGWTDAERWDVVAYLWQSQTTLEQMARGQELYRQDCAGCHGETGQGDGPGAAQMTADMAGFGGPDGPASHDGVTGHDAMLQTPADFTDPQTMAGATPWLLYAKTARGGMGTGMPYWGAVYTDDDLWAVVAYLWPFAWAAPQAD